MKLKVDCPALDALLEGGVEFGALTLLYGEAGSGKTNLCLQLARNVAREGRKVVYLDTEGVSLTRLEQIAGKDFKKVAKNILFSEPYNFEEQERLVDKAIKLAEGNPDVGLIVVDSATMHYRLTRKDEERADRKSLARQVAKLLRVARKTNVPVVLTSQVYTDIDTGQYEPLGGHMLTHTAKALVRLEKTGLNERRAVLVKHRHIPEGRIAAFRLTERGVES